jgi:hypothetical protein
MRGPAEFEAHYADTAIAKFYELMYRSYPPSDVFAFLGTVHRPSANAMEVTEMERYRWAVLEWGIRNWPRIIATGSRRDFFECARLELERNTGLLGKLFYSLGSLHDYDPVAERHLFPSPITALESFIERAIYDLIQLEAGRFEEQGGFDRSGRVVRLNLALHLFFLRLNSESAQIQGSEGDELSRRLITFLHNQVEAQKDVDLTFARLLYLRWGKKKDSIGIAWPLYVIAESLFRGDDGVAPDVNRNHTLLRGWLRNVQEFPDDQEFRALLQGSLGSFLAALEDLRPYFAADVSLEQIGFVEHATTVMRWLGTDIDSTDQIVPLDELDFCLQDLQDGKPLPDMIRRLFHPSVEDIKKQLELQAHKIAPNLSFKCEIDDEATGQRALILKERLCFTLLNWTASAITDFPGGQHQCKIKISRASDADLRSRLQIRVLSDYSGHREADEHVKHGRSWVATTETMMKPFDVQLSPEWEEPSVEELAEGFSAACNLWVPTGFAKREKR